MNYKNYQQVLDFAPGKKSAARQSRPVHPKNAPKRRTKTGCLTCRSRKKKCDEDRHGGKCQACIRNFLDCCWPDEGPKTSILGGAPIIDAPKGATTKSSPATIEGATSLAVASPEIPGKAAAKGNPGASAYPSPVASPRFEAEENYRAKEMQAITLPPIRMNLKQMKVQKQEKSQAIKVKPETAKFIVTSFDSDRALLQIKS